MKNKATRNDDEAVSVQVGFVLNTGILTAFIAIVLVLISGGFDDTSPQQELELVSDSVESKMIEADRLAETSDDFTAFFEPPESDLQYRGTINDSGYLTLTFTEGGESVERNIDSITRRDVGVAGGSEVTFSQIDQNVVVEYSGGDLELSVQRNATRSVP